MGSEGDDDDDDEAEPRLLPPGGRRSLDISLALMGLKERKIEGAFNIQLDNRRLRRRSSALESAATAVGRRIAPQPCSRMA